MHIFSPKGYIEGYYLLAHQLSPKEFIHKVIFNLDNLVSPQYEKIISHSIDQILEKAATPTPECYCCLDGYSHYKQIIMDLSKTTFTSPMALLHIRGFPLFM